MKRLFLAMMMAVSLFSLTGCYTSVETGEVGLRRQMDGVIQPSILLPGWHQTWVGSVILFADKEILLTEKGLHPQTKDKTTLADFSFNFTYTVDTNSIPIVYTKYSATSHMHNPDPKYDHEVFPMGNFVMGVVQTAGNKAVSEFDALELNTNRDPLAARIKEIANEKFAVEGLGGKIMVKSVNMASIVPSPSIVESANMVVNKANELLAKTKEVAIADQEALKMKALAAQGTDSYIRLVEAQAKKTTADALAAAALKGSTIWVVPNNFTALGNTAGK